MKFTTTILGTGKGTAGIEVSPDVPATLGKGKNRS